MRKRIIGTVLAIVICISMAVPAGAQTGSADLQSALEAFREFLTTPQTMSNDWDTAQLNLAQIRHGELIDFDHDGIPEMLLIQRLDQWTYHYIVVAYVGQSARVIHFTRMSIVPWNEIATAADRTFFASYGDGMFFNGLYYTVENGQWVRVLSVIAGDDWETGEDFFMINDVEVSREEYQRRYAELGIISARPLYEGRTSGNALLVEINNRITAITTPSTWAAEYVIRAVSLNLVPQNLQSNFTQAITRAEFAALAVLLYETVTEREIATDGSIPFTDTNDINALKAAAIGVTTGTGDGTTFSPNLNLTREQAATMLSRLAVALANPLPSPAPTFADNADLATWSFDAVGQMQATNIMGGIGGNRFDPRGAYTREQSIITIVRLWDILG